MQIGILGTGMVGRALAEGFVRTGHDVSLGTRDVHETMVRQLDGTPASIAEWLAENPSVALADFASVAGAADVVVNATNGSGTLAALTSAGAANLAGKVLLDVAVPLDFSKGFPPTLTVKDTDSLGEQVQRAFPEARVVKSPEHHERVGHDQPRGSPRAHHRLPVGGRPAGQGLVAALLAEFGWTDILDLGDITTSRGPEMWLPALASSDGSRGWAGVQPADRSM